MKIEIDIKRPSGQIETLNVTDKFCCGMNDEIFAKIVKSTVAAGRGLPIVYRVIADNIPEGPSASQIEYDRHCAVMRKAMSY